MKRKKRFRLRNLEVRRVDHVGDGANQDAHIVFAKNKEGDARSASSKFTAEAIDEMVRRQRKKRQTAKPEAQNVAKHDAPTHSGTGSSQGVHAPDGGGGGKKGGKKKGGKKKRGEGLRELDRIKAEADKESKRRASAARERGHRPLGSDEDRAKRLMTQRVGEEGTRRLAESVARERAGKSPTQIREAAQRRIETGFANLGPKPKGGEALARWNRVVEAAVISGVLDVEDAKARGFDPIDVGRNLQEMKDQEAQKQALEAALARRRRRGRVTKGLAEYITQREG